MSSGNSELSSMCDACFNTTNDAPWLSPDSPKLSEFLLVLCQWSILPLVAAFYKYYSRSGATNKGLDVSTKQCLMYAPVSPLCIIATLCVFMCSLYCSANDIQSGWWFCACT